MGMPKHIVSIWPKKSTNSSNVKALAKVIFGDAVSIFPIRLTEGKNGLHLLFPKEKRLHSRCRPIVVTMDSDAVAQLTNNVLATYRTDKATCRSFEEKGELEIECDAYLWNNSVDHMVGTASITINQAITIFGIRLFEYESGTRFIIFPERECWESGEIVVKRILDFRYGWEDFITKSIWRAYEEELVAKNHRERR